MRQLPDRLVAGLAVLFGVSFGSLGCEGGVPKGPDAANFCKGSAYDPCVDEHGCALVTGAACQPVGSGNFVVCTLMCTVGGTACPDDITGAPGTCQVFGSGSSGFCAPAAKNNCTANPI